jgi:hypothetical protein
VSIVSFLRSLSLPFEWWVVVAPWEQGVRIRRGKNAKRLGPGLHFKIPLLDRVYVVAIRRRMISDKGQTMMTKDGRVLTVNFSIQYAVSDVLRLFESISNPEMTLIQMVQAKIAEAVSSRESTNLSPAMVGALATPDVAQWGISDVEVHVTTFAQVRTLRLLMNEYGNVSGLDGTLNHDEDRRAAR